MTQPTPAVIATRLANIFSETSPRKKTKAIRLTKAQFNAISERTKIEDAILDPITRALWKHRIRLVRIADSFALLDEATLAAWLEPERASIRNAIRQSRVTTKSSQAAWPYPTASRP